MLIFDSFKTEAQAVAFKDAVAHRHPHLESHLCASQDESDRIDPFPFSLRPPIVLVGRTEFTLEEAVTALVVVMGGKFAGT